MKNQKGLTNSLYALSFFFLTITGFGQMPIFKRYYIADIPGFAWLAKFYVTYFMHYLFAVIFIGLAVYVITDYFLGNYSSQKRKKQITASGYLKAFIILCLIISGGLLVIKNLPGASFAPAFISILDIIHLCLCMALLFSSFYTLIRRKKWVIS
ncbi:MAG: hypothetical protein ACMUIP_09495 [bacterium]